MNAVYGNPLPPATLPEALAVHRRLRSDLGGYGPDGHLRLHDLGELIRCDARMLGLTSVTEVPVGVPPGKTNEARIDWVLRHTWPAARAAGGPAETLSRKPSAPVCAMEIEGRNVETGSLEIDHWKLNQLPDALCLIVLFQIDHNLGPKPPGTLASAVQRLGTIGPHAIQVLMDVDVWEGRIVECLWTRLNLPIANLAAGLP